MKSIALALPKYIGRQQLNQKNLKNMDANIANNPNSRIIGCGRHLLTMQDLIK
jgi:hypothetical protein